MSSFAAFYKRHLNTLMFAGILLGFLLGIQLPSFAGSFSFLGELFLRMLTLLIVPVVVISMVAGVLGLGDPSNLGRIGGKAFLYYMVTTGLAVITGLALVNAVNPGASAKKLEVKEAVDSEASKGGLTEVVRKVIPKNIVKAANEGNVLGLIFFSVFLGVALLSLGEERTRSIREIFDVLFQAVIWMVDKVMLTAPIGVFALVANLTGDFASSGELNDLLTAIKEYSFTVIGGLLIHGVVTLSLLAWYFRVNPIKLFGAMFPAVTTAFSTASSAATLPVTIDSLENRAGVSNKTASFVAPLGATVNMDGTAIYEAVAAIFIATMYGVELSFSQQLIIFLTATFSAVGAAGIPGAGLIMMTLVLSSVGLPVEGINLVIVVDRILDMFRTAINVWGDSIGTAIIAKSEGEEISVAR